MCQRPGDFYLPHGRGWKKLTIIARSNKTEHRVNFNITLQICMNKNEQRPKSLKVSVIDEEGQRSELIDHSASY